MGMGFAGFRDGLQGLVSNIMNFVDVWRSGRESSWQDLSLLLQMYKLTEGLDQRCQGKSRLYNIDFLGLPQVLVLFERGLKRCIETAGSFDENILVTLSHERYNYDALPSFLQ